MTELTARIDERDSGRKLQYFVRGNLHVSYSQFSAAKAAAGLLVNGASVHANYILRVGDELRILLPDTTSDKSVLPEAEPVNIVYEDNDLCIIDKPAPLACQCTPKQPCGTLENRLFAHYAEQPSFVFRPLNRLDKGTSGLMAAAKHAHACQIMQRALHTEHFVREYLAIVEGRLGGEGCVDLPIAKMEGATVKRAVDRLRGQPALTHYHTLSHGNGRTLVRLQLETGRTHQIRVHMAALGHPIAGDFLYGEELPEIAGRFALHSTRIALRQPLTGAAIELSSPLPDELRRLIEP